MPRIISFACDELVGMGDHREHDAEVVIPLLPEALECLDLEAELVRALEIAPDAPPAEHRVMLVRFVLAALHVPELVGRGIECPHPDRFSREMRRARS